MLKKALLSLAIIAALLAGSYQWMVLRRPVLDENARKGIPGTFVKLSKGMVHYELAGPPEGEVVVLVHGLTTPYFIWDKTFPELVRSGFRVLRYDHYGRGFSDRPHVPHDHDLFDGQLRELISVLKLKTPVHLVGMSMGGGVCVTFTDRHPQMVSRVALISPLGFPYEEPFVRKLARVPLLGDSIMALAGEGLIKGAVKQSLYRFERFPEFMGKFEEQLRYRGYQEAILSTQRNLRFEPLMEAYARVGKQKRPMLLIWGRQDEVLPFSQNEKVKGAIPSVEFHPLDEAGHSSHYEQPEVVNPILVRFLRNP
jgi:pimeloyl-ACP methyl ester carboxylesterase